MRSTDAKQSGRKRKRVGGGWVVGGVGPVYGYYCCRSSVLGPSTKMPLSMYVYPPKSITRTQPIAHRTKTPSPRKQMKPKKKKRKTQNAKSEKRQTISRQGNGQKHLLRQCKLADMCVRPGNKYRHSKEDTSSQ